MLQCTLYIQCTRYSVHVTVKCYSVHVTMYMIQCTCYSEHVTVYSVQCTLYRAQCKVLSSVSVKVCPAEVLSARYTALVKVGMNTLHCTTLH